MSWVLRRSRPRGGDSPRWCSLMETHALVRLTRAPSSAAPCSIRQEESIVQLLLLLLFLPLVPPCPLLCHVRPHPHQTTLATRASDLPSSTQESSSSSFFPPSAVCFLSGNGVDQPPSPSPKADRRRGKFCGVVCITSALALALALPPPPPPPARYLQNWMRAQRLAGSWEHELCVGVL